MLDEKPKPTQPVKHTLMNTKTNVWVEDLFLSTRDAEVLNKVFFKHKIPVLLRPKP